MLITTDTYFVYQVVKILFTIHLFIKQEPYQQYSTLIHIDIPVFKTVFCKWEHNIFTLYLRFSLHVYQIS